MYKAPLFQNKSQFNTVFNFNPGNQFSAVTFLSRHRGSHVYVTYSATFFSSSHFLTQNLLLFHITILSPINQILYSPTNA
jgi:hypothetical protein